MSGFGGMISVEMGTRERAAQVLERTRIFSLAESLGGVESLISHPATMTHASVPAERRAELGITDGLIRLSCGVEDVGRPARRSRARDSRATGSSDTFAASRRHSTHGRP